MRTLIDYNKKFASYKNKTFYEKLDSTEQNFIKEIAYQYRFTFQEFRQIAEASRDLTMWAETKLSLWWKQHQSYAQNSKEHFFTHLQTFMSELKNMEKNYNSQGLSKPKSRKSKKIISQNRDKKIFGLCPVASDQTICCQLRTIDAVENCIFACSYCTIQTFYSDKIIMEEDIKDKLRTIPVEDDRFYHFGTGQSSDSLVFGNQNGILEAHCEFARQHPNILMEFKTKSNNIEYFLTNEIPDNVVCSWTLNPGVIIKNEEYFTASLAQRIESARLLANRSIKVAFHFHPMIYYQGWSQDYPSIAATLINTFSTDEVLFVSFGSVTLIKPVINKIREIGNPTKILQMNFVTDPHGKFTYPDDIKLKMYKLIYNAFSDWHEEVFIYLCMEKASIWKETFGYVYKNNDEFEQDFGNKTLGKINTQE
jgi:spore photoproduct lyase